MNSFGLPSRKVVLHRLSARHAKPWSSGLLRWLYLYYICWLTLYFLRFLNLKDSGGLMLLPRVLNRLKLFDSVLTLLKSRLHAAFCGKMMYQIIPRVVGIRCLHRDAGEDDKYCHGVPSPQKFEWHYAMPVWLRAIFFWTAVKLYFKRTATLHFGGS